MTTKKEIQALERFIQNIYTAEELSSNESINNLEKSLVEIVDKVTKQHRSNGLLITSNGYFLTADHCAENYSEKLIRDYQGNVYPIIRVCQENKNEDIALLKIEKEEQEENYNYKIKNINLLLKDYTLGYLVEHKSRRDGKIISKLGKISKTQTKFLVTDEDDKITEYKVSNGIDAKLSYLIPGDSGGILLSYGGALIGFNSGSLDKVAGFTTIFSGLDLVQKEINTLKSPLRRLLRKFF